jgi:hypothetical protein
MPEPVTDDLSLSASEIGYRITTPMPLQPRHWTWMSRENQPAASKRRVKRRNISIAASTDSHGIETEIRCDLLNRKVLADTRASRPEHSSRRSGKLQHTQPHIRMLRAPEEPPVRLRRYILETEYGRGAMQNLVPLGSPSRLERAPDPGEQRDRKNSNYRDSINSTVTNPFAYLAHSQNIRSPIHYASFHIDLLVRKSRFG